MAEVLRPARLSGGQRAAVSVSVTLRLGLAAYGVAGSYQTVSGLAQRRGVPLALLVPVGIDGGLIGVVVLDFVLSWIGRPIGWLRQFVRVLTVGTVAANGAAGWPDLVSAGLHVAAPLMLLAMVEAGRRPIRAAAVWPAGRVGSAMVALICRARRWARMARLALAPDRAVVPVLVLLHRRWVVERSFAWLTKFRRLVRDYETLPATHEAMIWTAATWQLSNRLTR